MDKKLCLERARKARNRDLLLRMQSGDALQSYSTEASFFPPRPMVEKDKEAMRRLYKIEVRPLREVDKKR